MLFLFYFILCFSLVIFQTTVSSMLPPFNKFYNLQIPFVLCLGLFRPLNEAVPVIFFLGFVMDSLSGAPFGLYITTYLWLFISVRWIAIYFDSNSILLLPFVVVGGVLIENFIFLGFTGILDPDFRFLAPAGKTVSWQILWALGTGTFFILFINNLYKRLDKWLKKLLV